MSDPILEAALGYHEAGFCVLPVTKDKTPYLKWEQYQERWRREGQTRQDVEYLFDCPEVPRYGVAIITHPYSPLVALDFDGPCAAVAWEKTGIELPETATNYSQSGCPHLFFRPPEATDGLKRSIRLAKEERPCGWKDGKACGVDLICNGYIVVPPTPGYKEDADHPFGSFADLPAAIFDLIKRPGSREERDEEDGAPIFGGHRNNTLTSLAGSMRRRGMGEAAIFKALLEENAARCRPPLPEAEVRDIAESVARYKSAEGATIGAAADTWTLLDAAEYRDWPVVRPSWVVKPIITKGTIGYLGGLPKVGKSLFILDQLLHQTHGVEWLGRFEVAKPGPVTLYIAREDHGWRLQERITESQLGYGFPPIPPGRLLILSRERFHLTDAKHLTWLRRIIHERGVSLLVLDVLGRMLRGLKVMDEGDWAKAQDILEELNRDFDLTIVLLDHARKPILGKGKVAGASPVDLKGPIERYGGADWMMMLSETDQPGRLEVYCESKDTDQHPHFIVEIAPMGAGGPKIQFVADVEKLATSQRQVGEENRAAVMAVFRPSDRLTRKDIVDRLARSGKQLSERTISAHLNTLVKMQPPALDSGGATKDRRYWLAGTSQEGQNDSFPEMS